MWICAPVRPAVIQHVVLSPPFGVREDIVCVRYNLEIIILGRSVIVRNIYMDLETFCSLFPFRRANIDQSIWMRPVMQTVG
jgi:hypothetical protein